MRVGMRTRTASSWLCSSVVKVIPVVDCIAVQQELAGCKLFQAYKAAGFLLGHKSVSKLPELEQPQSNMSALHYPHDGLLGLGPIREHPVRKPSSRLPRAIHSGFQTEAGGISPHPGLTQASSQLGVAPMKSVWKAHQSLSKRPNEIKVSQLKRQYKNAI